MLSSIDELQTLIDQLHYREHRRVAIQGKLAACRYVENEEFEASQVQSHEGMDPFVSHHGNTELVDVDQTPGAVKRKHQSDGAISHNIPEEPEPYCEPSNVTMVKRRKTNVVEYPSPSVQSPAHDVNTNLQEALFFEDEEPQSSVEESDRTWSPGRSWESAYWSEVKYNLTSHFHYSTVFPESLPRKYDYKHQKFLMQQYNLHPAKLMKSMCTSKLKIEDFTSASGPGHYEVTILGINHDLAIDVSLPVYKNFRLFEPNCLPDQMQCLDMDLNAETQDQHWLSLKDELVKYASAQDTLHTVCILDICHLGESKVEIFLNRVYYPIAGELP